MTFASYYYISEATIEGVMLVPDMTSMAMAEDEAAAFGSVIEPRAAIETPIIAHCVFLQSRTRQWQKCSISNTITFAKQYVSTIRWKTLVARTAVTCSPKHREVIQPFLLQVY